MQQVAKAIESHLVRLSSIVVMFALSTCATSAELESLNTQLTKFKQETNTRFTQQSMELFLLRDENKKLWRNLHCADPRVADFMAEAEQCQSGQCPQKNLDRVLGFMATQKHVLIRLRPNQAVTDMAPNRVTQLRDMLEPRQITSLSRLLMLSMQSNMSRGEPADLAEKQADTTLMYIRRTLQLAPNVPRVGPFPVTCQNKAQLLDEYAHKFSADRAVLGEPKSKDPQVAIWIFKVDC